LDDFLFNSSDLSFMGAVILLSMIFLTSSAITQAAQTEPWEQKHKQLQQLRNVVFTRLEEVHATLVARVQDEAPALLIRLSLNPPKARATGYELLPVIQDNAPQVSVVPTQTFYSLEWLEGRLHEELEKAEKLAELAQSAMEVESLVDRFEKSLKTLRNLEDNLSYHEKWQKAVIRYPAYYRNKNKLVALTREMNTLITSNGPPEQIAELRRQLIENVAPFKPTPGLHISYIEGGEMVLPVTVCTDIEDSDFLWAFQEGVQESFSRSPAARAARFAVDLQWRFIGATTLYPDGAPHRGAKIDMNAHRALFPGCPLVLTSGASSLNARVGSRIFLGTGPVSRRTLAHEFGHLLGFEDAYARGYDGEPGDAYGVVIVEWTGLTADLMGDSDRGQVSEAMITALITAYGVGPAAE
jgi:hypothetical protein